MYFCLGITLFFNEFELLFLQLKTLSRVCDHIIIVEAECNWRGELRKNLEFGRFLERFGDDIKGISYEYLKIPKENFKRVKDLDLGRHIAFKNEGMCRSIPFLNYKSKYYIYNDVDEIFSDGQIEEIMLCVKNFFKGKKEFKFYYHNYYLNWRCFYFRNWRYILRNRDWNQVFCKNKPVIGDQCAHLFDYESGKEFALQVKAGGRPLSTQTDLRTIGYHFSYLYSLETKLENFAHTELTHQASIVQKRKEQKIAAVHIDMKCKSIPITDIQIRDLHEHIDIFRPFIGS